MSRFVVDASVAVKWFIPEVHSELATSLLEGNHDLVVPDLLFPEFANVLWKKVRKEEIDKETSLETLETLSACPLTLRASESLMPAALELAIRLDRTVYDCTYLALAIDEDCPFVTADRRFQAIVQPTNLAPHCILLTELLE